MAPGLASGRGEPGTRQLADVLHALAAPLMPSAETVAGVIRRARRSRRRRRIVRSSLSALVLAGLAVGGPLVFERVHRPASEQAEPPAAVVDMATAYPLAEGPLVKDDVPDAGRPVNALAWPSRGVAVSAAVQSAARDYLLEQAKKAGGHATAAVVEQLWAADEGSGVFFVLQGWTSGAADADTSRAVLLAGEYAPGSARIVMYEAPLRFSHPAPGEGPQPDDVADIAELSVWSPASDRLVVLGAPQVTEVLYAHDGRTLIEEPTDGGVAVFARGAAGRRGYADVVQVRDAQNQALTPPGAWSAADVVLSGDVAVYSGSGASAASAASGWKVVQATSARGGVVILVAPSVAAAAPDRGPSGGAGGNGLLGGLTIPLTGIGGAPTAAPATSPATGAPTP